MKDFEINESELENESSDLTSSKRGKEKFEKYRKRVECGEKMVRVRIETGLFYPFCKKAEHFWSASNSL